MQSGLLGEGREFDEGALLESDQVLVTAAHVDNPHPRADATVGTDDLVHGTDLPEPDTPATKTL
jgi:hypothetical protein